MTQQPLDDLAVAYALGGVRGPERRRAGHAIAGDARLNRQVESLEAHFAALDSAAPAMELPSGLYEAIAAKIEAEGPGLPNTLTVRADEGGWIELAPGVAWKVLHEDRDRRRRSSLIRIAPGATYAPHAHDDDEECLVMEGDLSFGELTLRSGDYHLAPKGVLHPAGFSRQGCLLFVSAAL